MQVETAQAALPSDAAETIRPDLKNPADALLHAVVIEHFSVMKEQSDQLKGLLTRFQDKNKMILPPEVMLICVFWLFVGHPHVSDLLWMRRTSRSGSWIE